METKMEIKMVNQTYECDCEAIHENVVEHVRKNMQKEEAIYKIADFFKVLGDNTRMRIMCALAVEEMCVCDLAVLLNMTKSAISHQLKKLKEEQQVKSRREGKNIYYSLEDEHVKCILNQAFTHIGHEHRL